MNRKFDRYFAVSMLACLSFLCSVSTAAVVPTFRIIPRLPGATSVWAHAISGDGSTVVGEMGTATAPALAFRWTAATGTVGLGDLPGGIVKSSAHGVSFNGTVIVGESSSSLSDPHGAGFYDEPIRWTSASGIVGLGLGPLLQDYAYANDVSGDGTIVVGGSEGGSFRWTQAGGIVTLGQLAADSNMNWANAVSRDGSVIAGMCSGNGGRFAFRWTAATGMQSLGVLAPTPSSDLYSEALGISADGSTIVGESYFGDGVNAFRWTSSTGMVSLGTFPGGTNSRTLAASADGGIIVGDSDTASGASVAFIWDEVHGMRNLKTVLTQSGLAATLNGWQLRNISGISDDGQTIVGGGISPSGIDSLWVATLPVPEPSSLALAGMGLIAAVIYTYRRRYQDSCRRYATLRHWVDDPEG